MGERIYIAYPNFWGTPTSNRQASTCICPRSILPPPWNAWRRQSFLSPQSRGGRAPATSFHSLKPYSLVAIFNRILAQLSGALLGYSGDHHMHLLNNCLDLHMMV